MNDRDFILETLRKQGHNLALSVQLASPGMDGTQLNDEGDYIPRFVEATRTMNMLQRKAGQNDGFICKTSEGRIVRLIQNYDSDIFTAEPEELPAQWGFVWSKDPKHALPFIALATSPYNTDECCTESGDTYKSLVDGNVWAPSERPEAWEKINI